MPQLRAWVSSSVWAVVLLTVFGTIIVGFLGSVAGPSWTPQPHHQHVTLDSTSLRITAANGHKIDRPAVGTFDTVRHEIEIDLGEVTVLAWLTEPVGAPPGPGVVFIHGAGTVTPDAFEQQVQALASSGIRTLVPTKRVDTYSVRQRNYLNMADDYLQAWKALRNHGGVVSDQVGFYGESEGAWIAPVAAAAEPEVGFIILASAAGVTPREQAAYATTNYLHNTNAPKRLFRAIPRALGTQIPGGGFDYVDFDVSPYLSKVRQPVLMLYGTADASMPVVQGALATQENLARGGNTQFAVRYFAQADHGLRVDNSVVSEVEGVMGDWVWGLPATAEQTAVYAGAQPQQLFSAAPVPQPRWYASGNFIVYSAITAVVLGLAGVLMCASRVRKEQGFRPVYFAAIATVGGSWAAIIIFLSYISQIAELALNYELNDYLVWGGWVGVQVAGVFGVGVGVLSMRRVYRATRLSTIPRGLGLMGVWACHLGALFMLLIGSYWGVFPALG